MEWVQRAIKELEAKRDLADRVDKETGPLWASLVEALKDSVADYEAATPKYGRYEQSTQNHHVYAVRQVADTPNRNTLLRGIVVTLKKGEGTVTAQYAGSVNGERSASLGLLKGEGALCVMVDGSPMLTQGAAEYFLKPFLFPELELP